ncbi:MAG: hypothetical protein JNM57_06520 [Cyclobacteriaceae bacterium]|nr:hypothetical protein [Cyclobacteriaceae bacterium]
MKTLRKILFYLSLISGVLIISLTISVFLFKDKIINQFVKQANERLNTPVQIGKISVSIIEKFPQLSIVFHDVYVEDSHTGQYPLMTAKIVSFQISPIEVWKGVYTIRGLQIRDSETNLKIDANGKNNYTILKESGEKKSSAAGEISFELKNVSLQNTVVHYRDLSIKHDFTFNSNKLNASIQSSHDIYTIETTGDLTTEKFNIGNTSLLTGKSFGINSNLIYNDTDRLLTIKPSSLALRNSSFLVQGEYRWKDKNLIDITIEGKDTDIQTLLSLLPEATSSALQKYQSKGAVYFKGRLNGEISNKKNPSASVEFGFTNATLFHPDYKSRVEHASLTGSFASSTITDPAQAVLILKNITGTLNREPFAANFIIRNFTDPEVILDFKGRIDAAAIQGFYPMENLQDVVGAIQADISLEGKLQQLKKKATAQRVTTRGSVELDNISLVYGKNKIPLQKLKGSLQFNNNDLALSNVSGKFGNSDFLLNGFFKNIITFLLFDDQPIGIETDLQSNFIDLDQLFDLGFNDASTTEQYTFSISRNINLNFNCNIKGLRYKKFKARNVVGDLLVRNEMAVSRNLALKTMGGDLSLSGIVDAKNNKAIGIATTAKLTGIHLDSVFYVFDNFGQTFIESKHLRGKANADVTLELTLNQHLRLYSETLTADINAIIKQGELNNFEPLKKLDKYLHDDGLNNVRFSDLKNDIHIEKKTVYIPQMEVRTNVTELKISGTHTFDQRIDYRIVTPLRKRKITDLEAQGAVEEDATGQTKLYFKIIGTTDDYKVSYDTEAVKKKIANDLKNEVQELKDAFKNKGTQKKKELELQKDEYFDWE